MNKTQKSILAEIKKSWEKNSKLRFCQLLLVKRVAKPVSVKIGDESVAIVIKDNFYQKDEDTLKMLRENNG